ncbi:hypothetical protein CNMCM7691_006554 [Aspergillus felis]|uniref:Major facilitator superfamily (MFS) profile domain-containing protein n=1 Tax=Aspergillus felis TaxID=1287682 RepID=A0A8H6V2F2_9EURO|nr:hypothetical protein CNMCM7691_006554 [Aspergillus felis]
MPRHIRLHAQQAVPVYGNPEADDGPASLQLRISNESIELQALLSPKSVPAPSLGVEMRAEKMHLEIEYQARIVFWMGGNERTVTYTLYTSPTFVTLSACQPGPRGNHESHFRAVSQCQNNIWTAERLKEHSAHTVDLGSVMIINATAHGCELLACAWYPERGSNAIIIPVIPTALPERGVIQGNDDQRWVSILGAVFSASSLVASPITWYWIKRVDSLRWPFMAGLIVLTGATALLCVGTHLGLWISGRLLQGAANGAVWTVGSALLRQTVMEEGLGEAFGYIGMGMIMGGIAGPLLGGALYEHAGYYTVFGLAFALLGVDILLRIILIETKPATNGLESRGEFPGGPLPAHPAPNEEAGFRTVQTDISCAPQTAPPPDSKAVSALLSCPRLWVVLWGYMVTAMIMTAFDSVLALFVRERFGWNQSAQGLVFLAIFIQQLLNPAVGMIRDRYARAGRYMVSGAFAIGSLVLILLRFVANDSMGSKVLLCTLLAVVGLCFTFSMTPLFVEISDVVRDMEKKTPGRLNQAAATALGYGLMNSSWSAGALVGPFLAGFIKNAAGWATMAWALGLVVGVSAVLVLLFMGESWLLPTCRSVALCQNEVIDEGRVHD